MHQVPNTYQHYLLTVKFTVDGSFSSFFWAYCKTANMSENMEPAYIRKAVKFAELKKYVIENITNDFEGWFRANESTETLFQVVANFINKIEMRTAIYTAPSTSKKTISEPFLFKGSNLQYVLVPIRK